MMYIFVSYITGCFIFKRKLCSNMDSILKYSINCLNLKSLCCEAAEYMKLFLIL